MVPNQAPGHRFTLLLWASVRVSHRSTAPAQRGSADNAAATRSNATSITTGMLATGYDSFRLP